MDSGPGEQTRQVIATDLPIPTTRLLAFLDEIGLSWEFAELDDNTFVPGLCILQGRLLVDATRLKYPGDILHEAGHLAVTSAAERPTLGPGGLEDPGFEMAALAWSYAASVHLGLPPELVFHPAGYKGNSDWLIHTYQSGGTLGQPMLAWLGLTSWGSQGGGTAYFPAMARWVRE